MSRFLRIIPVREAVASLLSIAPDTGEETVLLSQAPLRILERDVFADHDMPGFARSIVDGYAVIAADTAGALESLPSIITCTGRIEMGSADPGVIRPGECRYVPTGGDGPGWRRCRCDDRIFRDCGR